MYEGGLRRRMTVHDHDRHHPPPPARGSRPVAARGGHDRPGPAVRRPRRRGRHRPPRPARLAARPARRRPPRRGRRRRCGPPCRSTTATPSRTRSARPASLSPCCSSAPASSSARAPTARPRASGRRPATTTPPGADASATATRRLARIPAARCPGRSHQSRYRPGLSLHVASPSCPGRVSAMRNVRHGSPPLDAPRGEVVPVLAAVVELDLEPSRRDPLRERPATTRRR